MMSILNSFIAGVLATLVMTGWTELVSASLGKKYHVIDTLAQVLQLREVSLPSENLIV